MKDRCPTNTRHGFTLLEMLIATTLTMLILGALAAIWQSAWRTADRTRAILRAHAKWRVHADTIQSGVMQRSGCMPMVADENAPSSSYPWEFSVFVARVHYILTQPDQSSEEPWTEDPKPLGANPIKPAPAKRWTAWDEAGTPRGGDNGPGRDAGGPITDGSSPDPAAGQTVKRFVGGAGAEQWGLGRLMMSRATHARVNTKQSFASGQTPAYRYDAFMDFPNEGANSLSWHPTMDNIGTDWSSMRPPTQWSKNAITRRDRFSGPFFGVQIVPMVALTREDGTTTADVANYSWSSRSVIQRVVNGPFLTNDLRSPSIQTGIYGPQPAPNSAPFGNGSRSFNDCEPYWGFGELSPSAVADPNDIGNNRVRATYGRLTYDNTVLWQCEAPATFVRKPGEPDRRYGMIFANHTNGQTSQPLQGYEVMLRGSICQQSAHPVTIANMGDLLSPNVPDMDYEDPRSLAGWWSTSQVLWNALGGRYGSLTNPTWWSEWSPPPGFKAHTWVAGYTGSNATGFDAPGHPSAMTTTVAILEGLDRRGGTPFIVRATMAWTTR